MTDAPPPCFKTRLQIAEERAGRAPLWRTTSTLIYASVVANAVITVPMDFITDGASVPRAPVAYWLFGGIGHRAAVVHDFLYQHQQINNIFIAKHLADDVYCEALTVLGVPAWRRGPMVAAVRACGGRAWRTGPERFRALNPIWQQQEETTGHITPRREALIPEEPSPPDAMHL